MMLVGLTGNIASGKSSVAKLFAAKGATIIDADMLARRAVEPGTPALRAIVSRWGTAVLAPDGSLDRAALRHVVFDRPDELEALNAIVHPEVGRLRDEEIDAAAARRDRVVVCDIPLLFERRLADSFTRIVLVDAPRPLRLERLMRDRGLSHEEAVQMIAAQMPAELKKARADFVIENAGTREQLAERVQQVWDEIARDANATASAPA
ncbi:MAG TPA: dephospho-CoA kinase [Gemmatimonadaceae bacterium]|nr:dephospho-CoA kinase [Gemmatimonadaceae bacterium]